MFTRKHYRAIAAMVAKHTVPHTTYPGDMVKFNFVNDLADYFAGDNPQFDRERFLTACGVEPEPPNHNICPFTDTDDFGFYLHECPDTKRLFLCESGKDNNIAEVFDGVRWNVAIATTLPEY